MYYNVDGYSIVDAAIGKSNSNSAENRRKDFLCVSWNRSRVNRASALAFFFALFFVAAAAAAVAADCAQRRRYPDLREERALGRPNFIRPVPLGSTNRRMHYTVHGDVITCDEPWWKRSRRICPNVIVCTRVSIAEHISLITTSLFQSRFKAAKEERIFSILSST